jgi:peptide-methionine (R)-S-oxide reductase
MKDLKGIEELQISNLSALPFGVPGASISSKTGGIVTKPARLAGHLNGWEQAMNRDEKFDVSKPEEEWQATLSPKQYEVLRQHGTEMRGSSPLNKEKRSGEFLCAGCGQALFESGTKYESGTGWPSFYEPKEGAVATTVDRSHLMTRTEVHCSRCGGHLGHVFDDGPAPTGLRYCMNGVAMTFTPKGE